MKFPHLQSNTALPEHYPIAFIRHFFFLRSHNRTQSLKAIMFLCASMWIFSPLAGHAASSKATYPGALPILAGIEKVQEDLQFTSLQRAVLDSIRNEYRSEAQYIYALTHFKDPESRTQAENAIRRLQFKYNRRVLSTLNKTQKNQLRQIQVQILGGFLLFRQSIQESLAINALQKAQIDKIEAKNFEALKKINRLALEKKSTPLQRILALHDLRKRSSAEALQVLTPAQQKQLLDWTKKGPPSFTDSP